MRKLKLFFSLLMVMLLSVGNVWATKEDVDLSAGTFANGTITWEAASNGITITQTKAASTTNVNSSYVAAPRIYKGQILSFEASGTCKITQIDIVYNGNNKGGTITAGVAISENTVTDNTSAISRTLGTASGGTHTFSSVDEGGLSAIYIQNPANASAQLRPTKITITYVGGSSKTLSSVTVSGTPTKTSYTAGENFDPAGLTVTGHYSEGPDEAITSGITWAYNPSQTLAENQTSIGVTATVSNIASEEYPVSITVAAAPAAVEYTLFSGDLEEGDYVIYYDGYAMKNTIANDRLQYEAVTPADNKITNPDASIVWHIAQSGSYWTIYNAAVAKYAAGTGAKNKAQLLADGTDNKSLWTASGDATYDFVNKANDAAGVNKTLRNNGTYGFACYATGTGGPLSLYRKVDSSEKPSAEIAFAEADKNKLAKVGAAFTAPTLVNPHTVAVTYASSDADVVAVSTDGATVTVKAAGKAIITASFAGNDNYKAGTASYTIYAATEAGTESDALTEASAKALIDLGCAMNVHVKGTVKEQHQTYYTVTLTDDFKFWNLKDLGNVDFTTAYLKAGDQVTAYGQLTKVGQNYELAEGCYLTAYEEYTTPKIHIANTKETAYTVAQALAYATDPITYETSDPVYIKGVVYNFEHYTATSNIYIRDIDKTVDDGKFEFFKCGGLKVGENDPVPFSEDEVHNLDTVIGYGVMTYYSKNDIWEFPEGNYVVEYKPYIEPTYTISFDANTNAAYTGDLPAQATVTKDDVYQIPAACLERTDNYYQAGWNTDKNATDKMDATELSNVQEDVVLYAIWKEITDCQITFYNIDTENAYDTKVKTQGVEYTFDDITAPTAPTGYTFAGWSTDQIPTEQENITPLTKVTPSSATMTLYAVYTRSEGETTISYQKVTSAPDDWSGNYLIVNEEAGVAFDGSLETLDATNDVIDVTINAEVIASSDAVDAAIFTVAASGSNYTLRSASGKYIGVSSNSNGLKQSDEADAYINSFGLDADNNAVISAVFDGSTMSLRYNKADNQNRFRYYKNAGQQAIQLYAQVIVLPTTYYTTKPATIYTVSFSLAEDESGNFEPINVVKGENAQLPTATPTKVHNTFNKWSDGENEYAAGAQIENVQGNIVLHATWNPATYATVTFDVNGASATVDPIEDVYEGENYTLPAAPAYDDAHVFTGWKLGDDVFAAEQVITMTTPAAAVEYVAQWADKTVTNVVILASYDDKWFALTNEVSVNKQVDAMQVDYYEGKVLNLSAENQAKITWVRTVIGDQVTFKNGDNYIVGNTGTELYLNETAFQWKLVDGEYLAKASNQQYKRTFIYSGGVDAFKNYDKANAGNEGYSAMPLVVEAAFGEGVAYTVVRENLEENRYYTVCLEKDIKEIKGASIWNLSKRSASLAYLEEASLPITAGTPFIIQATADKFEVIYDGDATPLPGNNGVLVGTFTKLTASNLNALTDAGKTIYMLVSNELRPIGTNNYLDAHRAYIDYDAFEVVNTAPSNAPGKRVRAIPMHKDVVTGFENLNATDKPVKLLIDGNIYILRGEKMYDATGRLVK